MAYISIQLADKTPSLVGQTLRDSIDPFFSDVHCMLRLPIAHAGLTAGCNVTIALSLLTIVAGVSATFYKEGLSDGKAFQGLLIDYYPWNLEPKDDLEENASRDDTARALWETFRNPLAHSLGMSFRKDAKRGRYFERTSYQVIINRNIEAASEEQIEQLENVHGPRPHMHATIHIWDGIRMLSVEALYWGLRRLLYRLTEDESLMSQVNSRLDEQFKLTARRQ